MSTLTSKSNKVLKIIGHQSDFSKAETSNDQNSSKLENSLTDIKKLKGKKNLRVLRDDKEWLRKDILEEDENNKATVLDNSNLNNNQSQQQENDTEIREKIRKKTTNNNDVNFYFDGTNKSIVVEQINRTFGKKTNNQISKNINHVESEQLVRNSIGGGDLNMRDINRYKTNAKEVAATTRSNNVTPPSTINNNIESSISSNKQHMALARQEVRQNSNQQHKTVKQHHLPNCIHHSLNCPKHHHHHHHALSTTRINDNNKNLPEDNDNQNNNHSTEEENFPINYPKNNGTILAQDQTHGKYTRQVNKKCSKQADKYLLVEYRPSNHHHHHNATITTPNNDNYRSETVFNNQKQRRKSHLEKAIIFNYNDNYDTQNDKYTCGNDNSRSSSTVKFISQLYFLIHLSAILSLLFHHKNLLNNERRIVPSQQQFYHNPNILLSQQTTPDDFFSINQPHNHNQNHHHHHVKKHTMNESSVPSSSTSTSHSMAGGDNGEQSVLLSQATTLSPSLMATVMPAIQLPIPQMIQFHHHHPHQAPNSNNNKSLVSSVLNTSSSGGLPQQANHSRNRPSKSQAQDSSLTKEKKIMLLDNKINNVRYGRQADNIDNKHLQQSSSMRIVVASSPDILVELIGHSHAKYTLQYFIFYLLSSSIIILISLRLFRLCGNNSGEHNKKFSANNNNKITQSNYGFYYTTRLDCTPVLIGSISLGLIQLIVIGLDVANNIDWLIGDGCHWPTIYLPFLQFAFVSLLMQFILGKVAKNQEHMESVESCCSYRKKPLAATREALSSEQYLPINNGKRFFSNKGELCSKESCCQNSNVQSTSSITNGLHNIALAHLLVTHILLWLMKLNSISLFQAIEQQQQQQQQQQHQSSSSNLSPFVVVSNGNHHPLNHYPTRNQSGDHKQRFISIEDMNPKFVTATTPSNLMKKTTSTSEITLANDNNLLDLSDDINEQHNRTELEAILRRKSITFSNSASSNPTETMANLNNKKQFKSNGGLNGTNQLNGLNHNNNSSSSESSKERVRQQSSSNTSAADSETDNAASISSVKNERGLRSTSGGAGGSSSAVFGKQQPTFWRENNKGKEEDERNSTELPKRFKDELASMGKNNSTTISMSHAQLMQLLNMAANSQRISSAVSSGSSEQQQINAVPTQTNNNSTVKQPANNNVFKSSIPKRTTAFKQTNTPSQLSPVSKSSNLSFVDITKPIPSTTIMPTLEITTGWADPLGVPIGANKPPVPKQRARITITHSSLDSNNNKEDESDDNSINYHSYDQNKSRANKQQQQQQHRNERPFPSIEPPGRDGKAAAASQEILSKQVKIRTITGLEKPIPVVNNDNKNSSPANSTVNEINKIVNSENDNENDADNGTDSDDDDKNGSDDSDSGEDSPDLDSLLPPVPDYNDTNTTNENNESQQGSINPMGNKIKQQDGMASSSLLINMRRPRVLSSEEDSDKEKDKKEKNQTNVYDLMEEALVFNEAASTVSTMLSTTTPVSVRTSNETKVLNITESETAPLIMPNQNRQQQQQQQVYDVKSMFGGNQSAPKDPTAFSDYLLPIVHQYHILIIAILFNMWLDSLRNNEKVDSSFASSINEDCTTSKLFKISSGLSCSSSSDHEHHHYLHALQRMGVHGRRRRTSDNLRFIRHHHHHHHRHHDCIGMQRRSRSMNSLRRHNMTNDDLENDLDLSGQGSSSSSLSRYNSLRSSSSKQQLIWIPTNSTQFKSSRTRGSPLLNRVPDWRLAQQKLASNSFKQKKLKNHKHHKHHLHLESPNISHISIKLDHSSSDLSPTQSHSTASTSFGLAGYHEQLAASAGSSSGSLRDHSVPSHSYSVCSVFFGLLVVSASLIVILLGIELLFVFTQCLAQLISILVCLLGLCLILKKTSKVREEVGQKRKIKRGTVNNNSNFIIAQKYPITSGNLRFPSGSQKSPAQHNSPPRSHRQCFHYLFLLAAYYCGIAIALNLNNQYSIQQLFSHQVIQFCQRHFGQLSSRLLFLSPINNNDDNSAKPTSNEDYTHLPSQSFGNHYFLLFHIILGTKGLLLILQVTLQTILIRSSCQRATKDLRQIYTFLMFANLSIWAMEICEQQQQRPLVVRDTYFSIESESIDRSKFVSLDSFTRFAGSICCLSHLYHCLVFMQH